MIAVTVFYPNDNNATFDADYYLNEHIPLVKKLLSPELKSVRADIGLSGGAPGAPAAFAALAHLHFETVDDFASAFATHAEAIQADVVNYTTITSYIQISETHQTPAR